MNWLYIGIDIFCGFLIAYMTLSTIYVIFDKPIDKTWNWWKKQARKIKYKIIEEPPAPPEPTVCEKLGDVKIYKTDYRNMQTIKENFDKEKKDIQTLIEHIFPAPQITNNKFMTDVIRIDKAFYKQYKSLHIYFRAYPSEDQTSAEVINKGMTNLISFYKSLQELTKELSDLIVCDVPIDNLMSDMEQETKEVKEYKKSKITYDMNPNAMYEWDNG